MLSSIGLTFSPFKKVRLKLLNYMYHFYNIIFCQISKAVNKVGNFLSTVGATPIKALRIALINGDEEKAILIYTTTTNGHSLLEDLHPSIPFPMRGTDDQTPLHLACYNALENILKLFLLHGGNPNSINGRDESSSDIYIYI